MRSNRQTFISDKDAMWAKQKIADYRTKEDKKKGGVEMTDKEFEEILKADRLSKSVYHPDTGEKVPIPFRMCTFVPMNMPIVFGMVCTSQTLLNVTFWQWLNQTYNACWNYSNRNATSSFTAAELGKAYAGAVTSSVGIALLGRQISRKFGITSGSISKMRFVNGLVSLFALSTAGFLNLYLIRYNETRKGITVSHKGKPMGLSQNAAKIAVFNSAMTRAVLPIPLLMFTPLCWKIAEIMKLAPKGKVSIIALDMVFIVFALTFSLPVAISLFKQTITVPREKLEPQYQHMIVDGQEVTHFEFNKGL